MNSQRSRQWIIGALAVWVGVQAASGWAAEPSDRSFFKQRQAPPPKAATTPLDTETEKSTEPAKPLTRLDELTIPIQHGSVKESSTAAPEAPILIHIQDAHANYEAQKHLAAILEHLIRKYGLSLVLVEGGSRNDSLSYMRTYAPLAKRKEVAEQFLKAGKISGENYLDLTTDYPFTVFGVEKPELYDANMAAFLKVEQAQPPAKQVLGAYKTALETLKEKLYPKEVKELEARETAVEKNEESLTTHYQRLSALATERKVSLTPYPNVQQFLQVSQAEKTIDFKAVELERGQILEELTKTLPKAELTAFLDRSKQIKKGMATASSFYRALKAKLTPAQLAAHKQLSAYCDYLERFEAINHAALFSEVESLSEAIKATYFTTPDQRALARLATDVAVLTDLVDLKLIPEKYDYYDAHKREFDPAQWGRDLTAMGRKSGVTIPEFDAPTLRTAVPAVEEFYVIARQRDLAMVDNGLKQLEPFQVKFAVLITGGFHTPAITELLKKRAVSYAVVAPKVPQVTEADIALYHKVLKETYVPMAPQHQAGQAVTAPPAGTGTTS